MTVLSTTVSKVKNALSISIITSHLNPRLLTRCLRLKQYCHCIFQQFLSPNRSPVSCFALLLPGGVLVEDHGVPHDYQQRPGSGHSHVESLQSRCIRREINDCFKDKHIEDFAGFIITSYGEDGLKQTFSFDRNPMLKSLSILT